MLRRYGLAPHYLAHAGLDLLQAKAHFTAMPKAHAHIPDFDVAIIGGGLAGLTCASLLGQQGLHVACIDAEPLARQQATDFDGRTTAISFGSRAVLEQAGVWPALKREAEAIKRIDILDGADTHTLTFHAFEVEADAFGWIVDNTDLRHALLHRVAALPHITHITGHSAILGACTDTARTIELDDGRTFSARLIIGADGRTSQTRASTGIGTWGRDYKKSAVVCLITHSLPHNGCAIEHFRPEGPLAVLPYTKTSTGQHRSAVVWTMDTHEATRWKEADAHMFALALRARLGPRYGDIAVAGPRSAWPLTLRKAYSYVGPRMVLMAEAAHGIHPIAGQGLNMSLRDAAALHSIIVAACKEGHDIGAPEICRDYQTQRRADNLSMALATDSLDSLFSNDFIPLAGIRRLGLRAVARLSPAKQFFMRQAMGLSGRA